MKVKTVRGEQRWQCPSCMAWGKAEDFYWRKPGTPEATIYRHRPCEKARSIASKKKGKAPAKAAPRKKAAARS